MRALIVTLMALILMPAVTYSQPERYELGQRLKAFEKEWDKQTDPVTRKRALAILPKVTEKFFSFQLGEAGRVLDQARWVLTSDKPMPDDVAWAWSLYAEPERRFVTQADKTVTVVVKSFYPVKSKQPTELRVRLQCRDMRAVDFTLDKIPSKFALPFPAADAESPLTTQFFLNEMEISSRRSTVTVAEKAMDDFADGVKLRRQADEKLAAGSIELATFVERMEVLRGLAKGNSFETEYSAATFLAESAQMLNLGKEPFFTHTRPGDFWMAVPTDEKDVSICRLFVPEKLDPKRQVPLVVALHGMGGSENLFFEGYGDGQIVKLCKERGWLLVAPRSPLAFGVRAPPVRDIAVKLATRYPIDLDKLFVVGHSMGAVQTVAAVHMYLKPFAGIALLGGGGHVKDHKRFNQLPTFIGVGIKDQIAFGMAKDLNKTLTAAKAGKLVYKEYEDLEHLVIVREALPDAFKMFDTVK